MKNAPFYMIYVEGEKNPAYKHLNLQLAESEAKRLAELTQKTAVVLTSIKSFSIPEKFIVADLRPTDDLPF